MSSAQNRAVCHTQEIQADWIRRLQNRLALLGWQGPAHKRKQHRAQNACCHRISCSRADHEEGVPALSQTVTDADHNNYI